MSLTVAFRADASPTIGSGHVMRCLTLATELARRGAAVQLLSVALPAGPRALVEAAGVHVRDTDQVAQVCDWVVVDHYSVGAEWERGVRATGARVLVIDDLADRRHDCDVLLDQNLRAGGESEYEGLVPDDCRRLVGPHWALLRPEFAQARARLARKPGVPRRLLVCFGGSDPTGETEKVLDAVEAAGLSGAQVDVIVGPMNLRGPRIAARCQAVASWRCLTSPANMAEILAAADLSVGAGGGMTWERCAVALPSIVISVADNQVGVAERAAGAGAISYLGSSGSVGVETIREALESMWADPTALARMSQVAAKLVDGRGVARVADVLFEEA